MKCEHCKGEGYIWVQVAPDDADQEPCEYCNGEGQLEEIKTMKTKETVKHTACSCRIMTVDECLVERGHYSPVRDDRGIKLCPLHASAPDLLEALKGILDWARRVRDINPGMEVSDALTAINKAEGNE